MNEIKTRQFDNPPATIDIEQHDRAKYLGNKSIRTVKLKLIHQKINEKNKLKKREKKILTNP